MPFTQRAFAVWWKDLKRWTIPTSVLMRRSLPLGWELVQICDIATQIDTKTKVEPENLYKMAGVKWYGEGVFHRETVHGSEMSATYVSPLVPGALIYNRLFAWKSSFAIVPDSLTDCFVSNEFPQFIPDQKRVLPEYLYLFCIQKATIRAVNAASTGSAAVSRNRFKESEFLEFEILLPPIDDQKKIVALWRKSKDKVRIAQKNINQIEQEIHSTSLKQMGLDVMVPQQQAKGSSIFWNDFERWSISFYRKDFINLDNQFNDIPHETLGNILKFDSRPWSKDDFPSGEFRYIEISSVSKAEGIIGNITVPVDKAPSRATTLVEEGDIILSTTRPYLGAFAIVTKEYDHCVCSSGFALSKGINNPAFDADFLLLFLKTDAGLRQMERRMTGGLYPAIVLDELNKVKVPLLPLEQQRAIARSAREKKLQISRERDNIRIMLNKTNTHIEDILTGNKPIGA